MHLSKDSIREYQEIYAREFGRDISESEAAEQAGRLVRLFALLLEDAPDSTPELHNPSFDSDQSGRLP